MQKVRVTASEGTDERSFIDDEEEKRRDQVHASSHNAQITVEKLQDVVEKFACKLVFSAQESGRQQVWW